VEGIRSSRARRAVTGRRTAQREVALSSLVQIVGALLVLAAFALAQARVVTPQARAYLLFNLVGGSVLAVDAYIGRQWGFLILEGVWALIAAWGLLNRRLGFAGRRSSRGRNRFVRTCRTRR
jgi:hypothetical protein